MTAKRTLEVAQTLYEQRKLLSYPRTDSRHLTLDVAAEKFIEYMQSAPKLGIG